MPMSRRFLLFQRDDCRLCDEALAVLSAVRAPEFESVFIDDAPDLESRYGTRVPVFRDDDRNRELDWPFDADSLASFLKEKKRRVGASGE